MIIELSKKNKSYNYKVKSNNKIIIESKNYATKSTALKGFKIFNRSIISDNIVIHDYTKGNQMEILDKRKRILARSINLPDKAKTIRLKKRMKTKTLILKDRETNKLRAYIYNIADIKLNEPLTIEIEKNGDYLATIKSLNLFAYGDNLESVISEIKEDLIDLHNDLFHGKHKLAKPAKNLKSNLERLIK